MMKYKAIRGMADILSQSAGGSSELRQWLEALSEDIFQRFGYLEIRTPILEEKALFIKSIGEETDIVTKEMFSFKDRGSRDVVLRPEGTAPIVRAYLEANLHKTNPFQKFYYTGPMFRAERPQAGRMRQFDQIGAEAIGSLNPGIDAEVIILAVAILDKANIKNYKIRINNLGCKDDKARLSKTLRKLLAEKKSSLCEDCKKRISINPLRVLDCKDESCRMIIRDVFKSVEFLCTGCEEHFKEALAYLDSVKIKYLLDPYIVRGLDYYTRTVFEISHPELGSQDAIGAGGRYDNLISDMGGPHLGAAGFALGVERILIAAAKQGPTLNYPPDRKIVYLAAMGEEAYKKGFELINYLRNETWGMTISFDMDYEKKSLKAQMREADKSGAKLVLIIGDEELSKGGLTLRNMQNKEQQFVPFDKVMQKIKENFVQC